MMTDTISLPPFLALARQLCERDITEANLPAHTRSFPPLDRASVDALAAESAAALLVEPRYGWAIAAVMAATVQQTNDPFLQALAQLYLARAANGYYWPKRAAIAAVQAKAGFMALNEEGWTAVCDWQANAIPWMRPNFTEAVTTLAAALPIIETYFPQFAPDCRLSLAYAYLLTGQFAQATVQVEQTEAVFAAAHDRLGQARCLYTYAAYQRRQSDFPAALENLEQALTIFTDEKTPVLAAITQYNLAQLTRVMTGDLAMVESMFQEAAAQFEVLDLPLWQAQCWGGLAQLYNYAGQPVQARQMLQQAGKVYVIYQIPGLQADNLLDWGQLELFRGNYTNSLTYFGKAQNLYQKVGYEWLLALSFMNQGDVHYQRGHYHQALHDLEQAYAAFQQQSLTYRIAGCAWRLSIVWIKLGDVKQAVLYLNDAIDLYEQCQQQEWLPQLFLLQAEIEYGRQNPQEAANWLRQALLLATKQGALPLLALTHRLLAEHLLADHDWQAAEKHLATAVARFTEMGMITEQAACLLALGRVYAGWEQSQRARIAWQEALALSETAEIQWQGQMALAHDARQRQMSQEALHHYRAGMTALTRQRRQLWQPALAGSYLHRTVPHTNSAIALAFQKEDEAAALQFVEESKAQTVMQQLTQSEPSTATMPDGIRNLVLEIRWLQNQLNQAQQGNALTRLTAAELHAEFLEKVKAYHVAMAKWERTVTPDGINSQWQSFTLSRWRQMAQRRLGSSWVALDYYTTETTVYCIIVTPDEVQLQITQLNGRLHDALLACTQRQCRRPNARQSLTFLGDILLPPALWSQLTPETTLIISPHGQLHQLPWAGLRSSLRNMWLVETAVPVIVPSLHSLLQLWQRPTASNRQAPGLLVTISDFQERHTRLIAVAEERQGLQQLLEPTPHLLIDKTATAANLQQRQQQSVWSTHPFLHVATHAFTDQITGRLSGIALYDRDLWLDELRQLTPLPPLVTFSACSGLRSRLYTGDEAMGLPTTCLAAGAQQVVGSLWQLLDKTTPRFMQQFYARWQEGKAAAAALAAAQRMAVGEGAAVLHWAGYQCIGVP